MAASIQRAVSDGTLVNLPLSIDYFDRAEILVLIDDLPVPAEAGLWEWVGTTDAVIMFTPPIGAGIEVTLKRSTATDEPRHVFSLGAQFLADALDENFEQVLRVAQEAKEGGYLQEVFQDVDMHTFRLTNLGAAIDPGDAVPLSQYQADTLGAYAAKEAAEAALAAIVDEAIVASAVAFTPTGTLTSTDVQAALVEVSVFDDPVAPAYLKTVSDILNGDPVSLLRFIPPAQHAAIRARTSTYDATADLTTAFNVTSNAATPQVELLVPWGLIYTSGGISAGKNLTLRGAGWRSKIRLLDGSNPAHIIKFGDGVSQFTFDLFDFELDGNRTNNPTMGKGLHVLKGYAAHMHNMRVLNCIGDAVHYEDGLNNWLNNVHTYNCGGYGVKLDGTTTDTHIIGGDHGFHETGGVLIGTACAVRGAVVWGGGQVASVGVTIAGINAEVSESRIEGHGQHGVLVKSGQHVATIKSNRIYANSFTSGTSGLYDAIHVEATANFGAVIGNRTVSAYSGASPYSQRYALNFAGAHSRWAISGNDFPLLMAASPPTVKSGVIVNGLLSTDETDANWSRSRVEVQLAATITTPTLGAFTKLTYGTEVADQLSEYTAGVFQPIESGWYEFVGSFNATATAAGDQIGLALYKNGAELRRIYYDKAAGAGSITANGAALEFAQTTDTFEFRYFVQGASTQITAGAAVSYAKIGRVAQRG